jgi:hypothetical protein
MSPDDFSFTLTIPGDAQFAPTLRAMVLHAAGYAKLTESDAAALADQVVAWAGRKASGHAACLEFERATGRLTIQAGGEVIARHP